MIGEKTMQVFVLLTIKWWASPLIACAPHLCWAEDKAQVVNNFLVDDFAKQVYQSFPSFNQAQELGKELSLINEKRKVQVTDSINFPPAIKKLGDLLASNEYVDLWSELTGIPNLLAGNELVGSGVHETNSGSNLDVHVDFNYVVEKNIIVGWIFLSILIKTVRKNMEGTWMFGVRALKND